MNLKKGTLFLKENDKVLAGIINRIGLVKLEVETDHFNSIVRSIVSQQLSTKAAQTIYNRLIDLLPNGVNPEWVKTLTINDLRQIGISKQKGSFILGLADFMLNDPSFFDKISKLNNMKVVSELKRIRGIGEWTAQMFLIFSLGRIDVMPLNDAGIQRSIMVHYRLRKKPTSKKIISLSKNWGSFSSIACIYLWRALDDEIK